VFWWRNKSDRSAELATEAIDTVGAALKAVADVPPFVGDAAHDGDAGTLKRWRDHLLQGADHPGGLDDLDLVLDGRDWAGARALLRSVLEGRRERTTQRMDQLREAVGSVSRTLDVAVVDDRMNDGLARDELARLKLAAEERSADEVRRCALEAVLAVNAVLDERERVWTSRLHELKAHAEQLQGRLQDAEERSTTDSLTDLMNRRGFDLQVVEALAGLGGGEAPATVIMFEVDEFAAIKGFRGNDVGNAVLQEVANALALSFPRRIAVVARHDGGEFGVLMRGTSRSEGLRQAERALLRIQCTTIKTPSARLTVTASAGVTELGHGDTIAVVFDRALTSLRRARTGGGNRADAAGPAPG